METRLFPRFLPDRTEQYDYKQRRPCRVFVFEITALTFDCTVGNVGSLYPPASPFRIRISLAGHNSVS